MPLLILSGNYMDENDPRLRYVRTNIKIIRENDPEKAGELIEGAIDLERQMKDQGLKDADLTRMQSLAKKINSRGGSH